MPMHRSDGRLTAQPATRRSKDVARELCKIYRHAGREDYIHHVAQFIPRIRHHLRNVRVTFHKSFREEKTDGQFLIVSRCPHRHADGTSIDLNLQRFLPRQFVELANRRFASFPAQDTFVMDGFQICSVNDLQEHRGATNVPTKLPDEFRSAVCAPPHRVSSAANPLSTVARWARAENVWRLRRSDPVRR